MVMAGHGPEFDPMGYYQTPMVDQPEQWEDEITTMREAQHHINQIYNGMLEAKIQAMKTGDDNVARHHRNCALRHGGVTCTC